MASTGAFIIWPRETHGRLLDWTISDIVQSFDFARLLSPLFTTLPPVHCLVTHIHLPRRCLAFPYPTTYATQVGRVLVGLFGIPAGRQTMDGAVQVALSLPFVWVGTRKAGLRGT